MTSIVDSFLEYLLLRRAELRATQTPNAMRTEALARLRLGRQKYTAADLLWSNGQLAEALVLARAALLTTLDAAAALDANGDWREALRDAALDPATIARIESAEGEARSREQPVFDVEVRPEHETRFEAMLSARRAVDNALVDATRNPAEVRLLRKLRVTGAVALALFGATGAVLAFRHLERPTATASAHVTIDGGFPASNAIDDDPSTEWILPDQTPGWLEVRLARPRSIRAVRLLNSHNRQFNNVATRDYTIEIYAGDRLLSSVDGTFPELVPTPQWRSVPIRAEGVTRVRFLVRTWHAAAGGLAELRLE